MPRIPMAPKMAAEEGSGIAVIEKLSIPNVSLELLPVVEVKATTLNQACARLSSAVPKTAVVKLRLVEPKVPGSVYVANVVNEVGEAPMPYCMVQVVDLP